MNHSLLLSRITELEGLASRLDPRSMEARAARHLCRDTRRRIRQGLMPPLSARHTAFAVRHHTSRLRAALSRKEDHHES